MIEIVANTEIQPGDYSKIMSEIRGVTSGITCDGDVVLPDRWRGRRGPLLGGVEGDSSTLAAVECPANARCAAPVPLLAIFDPQPISGHFWPRYCDQRWDPVAAADLGLDAPGRADRHSLQLPPASRRGADPRARR